MDTQATPQPESTLDVFSPEGVKGKIPVSRAPDYYGKGFKAAVRVTTPEGQGGWLPSDKVHDYMTTKGFKIGPPGQQNLAPDEVPDTAKDKSLTGLMGNGMPTQEDLNGPHPSAFADQAFANVKDAATSMGKVLRVGGGTIAKMALG
jgi:hypothetical protein